MKDIQENNYVIQYRKLTMLEILFNHENNHIDKFYLNKILKNLTNDIKMFSIVIDLNNLNTKLLNFFVRELRKKNISISITITNKNYECKKEINLILRRVNQLRFIVDENIEIKYIENIYKNLNTEHNNLIFLLYVKNVKLFMNNIKPMIENNDYIFNISVSNNLKSGDYWLLAKIVSSLKKEYPLKILYDLPCAGVFYKNLEGICPGFLCLMCIDYNGFAKLCYKSIENRKYNIKNDTLNNIFDKLYKEYFKENNCESFYKCLRGCPIHKNNLCNKFCYKLKGGEL